jgi:hypothetical protein
MLPANLAAFFTSVTNELLNESVIGVGLGNPDSLLGMLTRPAPEWLFGLDECTVCSLMEMEDGVD